MTAKGALWNWPARFWDKVDKSENCWLWTGAKQTLGYGHVWLDGRMRVAHRVAYEMVIGPIPDGLTLDHLCRVRHCVNPNHLQPVTLAENIARGENPAAINGRKTACPRGHELKEVLSGRRAGERYCPTCLKDRKRAKRAADAAVRAA